MSNHFEPVGERARWLDVYDLLRATEVNGVISYESMGEALGLDPDRDRPSIRSALYRAAKEFEEIDKRAITAVPRRGYRVVEPREHLGLARRHQKRSARSLVRGHSKAINVDLSKVDPETRKALEMVAGVIALQSDFNRRAEAKLVAHDKAIKSLVEAKDRTDAERDEFRERLERLEAGLNSST
jgi:hypothetical protein